MTQREIDSLNKRAQKRQQKQLLAQKREQALRERAGQSEGRKKAKLLRRADGAGRPVWCPPKPFCGPCWYRVLPFPQSLQLPQRSICGAEKRCGKLTTRA